MNKHLTKQFLASLTGLTLAAGLMVTAVAPVPTVAAGSAESALRTSVQTAPADLYHVRVNGVPMTQDPQVTSLNGECHVSLRAVAQAVLPDVRVAWDGTQAAVAKVGVLSLTAKPGDKYLVANGRYLYVPGGVQARNGSVLVPLNVLSRAMDFTCTWRPDGSLDITTGSGGILSGSAYYDEGELYWLSRIIYSESGNQPLSGKLAVGNVVLNRVKDSRFPDSIYGVIFQKNQFSPAASGSIYRTPNAESVVAAKLCLDGAVSLDRVLYFNRVGLNCWASRNRPYVATIAGHSFYA